MPHKANLVVRYRGTGARKPLLLLAHTDVVEAKREDWSMDPFVFTERDGYFYGRGTSDDKAQAAVWIANLIRYKREGFRPDRDIIVALTADEEGGGPYNGVDWLVKNTSRPDRRRPLPERRRMGRSLKARRSPTTSRSARSTSSTSVWRCTTKAATAPCRFPTMPFITWPVRLSACRNSDFRSRPTTLPALISSRSPKLETGPVR